MSVCSISSSSWRWGPFSHPAAAAAAAVAGVDASDDGCVAHERGLKARQVDTDRDRYVCVVAV